MEEEASREEADAKWAQDQKEKKMRDEAKSSKNAKRREKVKLKKSGGGTQSNEVPKTGVNLAAGRAKEADLMNGTQDVPAAVEDNGIIIHDDD